MRKHAIFFNLLIFQHPAQSVDPVRAFVQTIVGRSGRPSHRGDFGRTGPGLAIPRGTALPCDASVDPSHSVGRWGREMADMGDRRLRLEFEGYPAW